MRAPKGEHHDCSERVYSGRSSFHRSHCTKPAYYLRDIRKTEYPDPIKVYNEETFTFEETAQDARKVVVQLWFCGQHDPVAIAERDKKKDDERNARWAAETRARDDREARAKLFDTVRAAKDVVVAAAERAVAADSGAYGPLVPFEELASLRRAVEALAKLKEEVKS